MIQPDVDEALRLLLPGDVALSAGPIGQAQDTLFDSEMEAVQSAIPKRQAEFRAGRTHARRALRSLGCPDQPIPKATDRRPVWPDKYVGAITHSRHLAAAIVAPSELYWGLGLDLEPATPLSPDLHPAIARPEERERFLRSVATPQGSVDQGKLTFSIKEAVFKVYNPVMRHWLDFQDATIEIDPDGQTFEAHLVDTVPKLPVDGVLRGRWSLIADHVAAVLTLPRGARTTNPEG